MQHEYAFEMATSSVRFGVGATQVERLDGCHIVSQSSGDALAGFDSDHSG